MFVRFAPPPPLAVQLQKVKVHLKESGHALIHRPGISIWNTGCVTNCLFGDLLLHSRYVRFIAARHCTAPLISS